MALCLFSPSASPIPAELSSGLGVKSLPSGEGAMQERRNCADLASCSCHSSCPTLRNPAAPETRPWLWGAALQGAGDPGWLWSQSPSSSTHYSIPEQSLGKMVVHSRDPSLHPGHSADPSPELDLLLEDRGASAGPDAAAGPPPAAPWLEAVCQCLAKQASLLSLPCRLLPDPLPEWRALCGPG